MGVCGSTFSCALTKNGDIYSWGTYSTPNYTPPR